MYFFFALQRSEDEWMNGSLEGMLWIIFSPAVFLSFLSCLHICFKRRETDALDFGIAVLKGGGAGGSQWRRREEMKHNVPGWNSRCVRLLPDLRGNPGPSPPVKRVLTADADDDSNQTFEAGNEIFFQHWARWHDHNNPITAGNHIIVLSAGSMTSRKGIRVGLLRSCDWTHWDTLKVYMSIIPQVHLFLKEYLILLI